MRLARSDLDYVNQERSNARKSSSVENPLRPGDGRACYRVADLTAAIVANLAEAVVTPAAGRVVLHNGAGVLEARCEGESRKRSVRGVRQYRHRGKTKTADLTVTELTGPAITPTHRCHPGENDGASVTLAGDEGGRLASAVCGRHQT